MSGVPQSGSTAELANGLYWLSNELTRSLERVRLQIEAYANDPNDTMPLQRSVLELHQIRGITEVAQCPGVTWLADEMKRTAQAMARGEVSDIEATATSLLGATVQLADYMDLLVGGTSDVLIAFHPQINELRLLRGAPVASEAALFAGHLMTANPSADAPMPADAPDSLRKATKPLMPHIQQALTGWAKGQARTDSLKQLGKITQHLAKQAQREALRQLLDAVTATVECLLTLKLSDTLEIKRLVGQACQQLKHVAADGEAAIPIKPVRMIAGQLAFHVCMSGSSGRRASELSSALGARKLLGTPETVDALRSRMRGPTTSVLNRVVEELGEELSKVKDDIDLILRTGERDAARFQNTQAMLKRSSDTLSMLGLTPMARLLNVQNEAMAALDTGKADDPGWMEVATAVLRVESTVEEALLGRMGGAGAAGVGSDGSEVLAAELPARKDHQESAFAALRESLVNVSQLKELISLYIDDGEPGMPIAAAEMLGQVQSVLGVLEEARAAELIKRLRAQMRHASFASIRTDAAAADAFAEAVACVECHLEGTQQSLPHTAHYLDKLDALVADLEARASVQQAAEAVKAPQDMPAEMADAEATTEPSEHEDDEVDPEIRETFVEEAGDVFNELRTAVPALARDYSDREALTIIRRGFHTLKGSGRMVGANALGDLAWSVENLLNKCLDGARAIDADVLDLLGEVMDALPGITEAFGAGEVAQDHSAIIASANALARGEAGSAASRVDPDVYRVFREDSLQRLDSLEAALAAGADGTALYVDEPMVRALHTLRGSAAAASQTQMSELARKLERLAEALRQGQLSLDDTVRQLLADSVAGMRRTLEGDASALEGLAERADSAIAALPETATQAGQEHSLTIVVTDESSELLGNAEEVLRAWRAAPQNNQMAADVRKQLASVRTSAGLGGFEEIVAAADDLIAQIEPMSDEAAGAPGPGWFDGIEAAVERIYQMLDARRNGDVFTATPAAEDETAAHEAAPIDTFDDLPSVEGIELAEAEPDMAVDPREDAAAPAEPVHADSWLDPIDRGLAQWESDSQGQGALAGIIDPLQAFAAEPDFAACAPLAQALADAFQSIGRGTLDDTPALRSQLHRAVDVLHQQATAIAQGDTLVDDGTAGEIQALSQPMTETAPVDEVVEAHSAEASSIPGDASASEELVPAFAEATEVEQALDFDPDVAEIFLDEARELQEAYAQTVQSVEGDGSGAVPELRRILHTLKGGARMAGMHTLGDLTHGLESDLDQLGDSGGISGALLSDLSAASDQIADEIDAAAKRLVAPDVAQGDIDQAVPDAEAPLEYQERPDSADDGDTVGVDATEGVVEEWDARMLWVPEDEAERQASRRETARVTVEQLDSMLNRAGEVGIYFSRLAQQRVSQSVQLAEMRITIERLRGQIRAVENETEAQIQARQPDLQAAEADAEFDPLEMDRYTRMQELSRALSESAADLDNLHASMDGLNAETDGLLQQQGQVNTLLQQGLMSTLMVPFSRQVQRLQRVVRQTASEEGRQAELQLSGIEAEMDRNVLERITAPMEHLLRNAVVHGLEPPDERVAAGKPAQGTIRIDLHREGTQLIVEVADDGRGLDLVRIRELAIERGLMPADAEASDEQLARLIFHPGFSTARTVTQTAGRGVGMDVVADEVSQLGGTVDVRSDWGKGVRFVIRLPLSLAISQALLVVAGGEQYAVPIGSVDGVSRLSTQGLLEQLQSPDATFEYSGERYALRYFGRAVGLPALDKVDDRSHLPVLLARHVQGLGGEERLVALVVDELLGSREIVSKPVGPQVAAIEGIAGATIMPDGKVVLILDLQDLLHTRRPFEQFQPRRVDEADTAQAMRSIMVVDDSITMRRVAERVLTRNGYLVSTARDGLEAMGQLQTESPDAILLDIEMPKADGFEVATFVRNNDRLAHVPIVMITSRSGDKHRERAARIGVNRYMIKPYQEAELLRELEAVLDAPADAIGVDA